MNLFGKTIGIKRSLGLALLCFLICINYHILRNLKDSLMLTHELAGAEAIPFLKTWVLIPGTVILISSLIGLSNRIRFSTLFYTSLAFFSGFYGLYLFLLHPFRELITPHATVDWLQMYLPTGWHGFLALIRYWPDSLFYLMAESWAVIIWYILFTGFANELMTSREAQKTYPWIILSGNISAIFAGLAINALTAADWEVSITRLTLLMSVVAILIAVVFNLMNQGSPITLSNPFKMSFGQSLRALLSSRYLLNLAMIVFGFNVVINLTEVIWKDQVLSLYPEPSDYCAIMGQITIMIGVVSALTTLMLTWISADRFHWTVCAVMTPLVTMGSALVFFIPIISPYQLIPAATIVLLGSLHIIFSRSTRYTLFDLAKELALIPLPSDQKFKAKSHIDGVGSRLGKATSSGLFQILLIGIPSVSACAPIVFLILLGITGLSLKSIAELGKSLGPDSIREHS